jgi:hypothetical protein
LWSFFLSKRHRLRNHCNINVYYTKLFFHHYKSIVSCIVEYNIYIGNMLDRHLRIKYTEYDTKQYNENPNKVIHQVEKTNNQVSI